MESYTRILRLNKAGLPTEWVSCEVAATLIVKEQVIWSIGDANITLNGGISKITGRQSHLVLPSIIACDGSIGAPASDSPLTNRLLFRRDHHICMYCGMKKTDRDLSRDHVIPRSKGGPDIWMNVVTSCKRCNNAKGDKTPEQAGMPLLATPYIPNVFEYFYLANRHILVDQMDFLKHGFSDLSGKRNIIIKSKRK